MKKKKEKNYKKKLSNHDSNEREFTLNDCANAETPRNSNKSNKLCNVTLVKRVINHIDDLHVDTDEDLEDNQINGSIDSNQDNQLNDHIYNDYHIDVWSIISEYIQPEDTKRFALICQKTAYVICSGKYWNQLYQKYTSHKWFILPKKFQPDNMDHIRGLRAKVICSLFYTYPLFLKRLEDPRRHNPTKLEKLFLIQTWFNKDKENVWSFYYRFSNQIIIRKSPQIESLETTTNNNDDDAAEEDTEYNFVKFVAKYNNIFENPVEGQYLLVVKSQRYIPFPNFSNQKVILSLIKQPLTNDLRSHALEMSFQNYINKLTVAIARYDDLINVRVYNWWDPEFSLFN